MKHDGSEFMSLAGADREAQTIMNNKLQNYGQPALQAQQSESDIHTEMHSESLNMQASEKLFPTASVLINSSTSHMQIAQSMGPVVGNSDQKKKMSLMPKGPIQNENYKEEKFGVDHRSSQLLEGGANSKVAVANFVLQE